MTGDDGWILGASGWDPWQLCYWSLHSPIWRLSEHRRAIEALTALQTNGPPIEVPWEHDALGTGARTQAAEMNNVCSYDMAVYRDHLGRKMHVL